MPHSKLDVRTAPYAAFLQRVLTIFMIASLVNYPWGVGQMAFYEASGTLADFARHCIIPSLGDGILVLLIYMSGLVAFKLLDWTDAPSRRGYTWTLGIGLVIAVAIEWLGVYGLGRWRYSELMPLVPVLNVGVLPILQMPLLPALIFRLVAYCFRRP